MPANARRGRHSQRQAELAWPGRVGQHRGIQGHTTALYSNIRLQESHQPPGQCSTWQAAQKQYGPVQCTCRTCRLPAYSSSESRRRFFLGLLPPAAFSAAFLRCPMASLQRQGQGVVKKQVIPFGAAQWRPFSGAWTQGAGSRLGVGLRKECGPWQSGRQRCWSALHSVRAAQKAAG